MLGRVTSAPRRTLTLPLLAVLFTAVGCAAQRPAVPVPTPRGDSVRHCRALHKELPKTLDGAGRGTAEPASDFTAVWGDPAVRLRCGVPKPEVLTPGSEHYNPNADAAEVNGVEWLFEKERDQDKNDIGYRFTTVLRKTYVEVTVPKEHAPEVNVLTDLADAVKKTIPAGV
ncbi:DUF3515 domain-containing protein [Streptomyces sp. MST-110588]|uniref:DUF3515 domain-containing protein n=1 Tax=Streptomyces sp. MST-110588 TaxID=2833628 RepID=UPI001F5E048F|nr:DUF3515 domain-containing protein [Streptomyces sp. MST-110588]UNO39735.1 DUF3515 domain-containing protein [Streptomyces sp. MST-110588]